MGRQRICTSISQQEDFYRLFLMEVWFNIQNVIPPMMIVEIATRLQCVVGVALLFLRSFSDNGSGVTFFSIAWNNTAALLHAFSRYLKSCYAYFFSFSCRLAALLRKTYANNPPSLLFPYH